LSPRFSDIVEQIKQEGDRALTDLYVRYRTEFIQWLCGRLGCDKELAKDIYQQSILIFYENIQSGKLTTLTSQVKTYLFSIGRNKYYEAVREQRKSDAFKPDEVEEEALPEELLQKVEAKLEILGEPCRSLLIAYYYHKRSMEQLVLMFDYKNADSAKNQKYKCLERLRKLMKENE
jgi:RNA polymerase sigma factor (sigma-70 family)